MVGALIALGVASSTSWAVLNLTTNSGASMSVVHGKPIGSILTRSEREDLGSSTGPSCILPHRGTDWQHVGFSGEGEMANVKPRFMRRETYAGFKVPIVVDLVALGILIALTATVGLVWFGRRDIAQNQSITA